MDALAELAEVGVADDSNFIVTEEHAEFPPPPPRQLATSPLVEELLGWVRELREGRQRRLVLAYLCHGLLAFEYGGNEKGVTNREGPLPRRSTSRRTFLRS